MAVSIAFRIRTERFLDREVADSLDPVTRKFFMRAGGVMRTFARRSLRPAAQLPLSALTDAQRRKYQYWVNAFKAGQTPLKPRRPEKTAEPGKPPLLHVRPQNPLKSRLFFALNDDGNGVVAGPEKVAGKSDSLQRLEANNPFMAPALAYVQPRLPDYLRQAAGTI